MTDFDKDFLIKLQGEQNSELSSSASAVPFSYTQKTLQGVKGGLPKIVHVDGDYANFNGGAWAAINTYSAQPPADPNLPDSSSYVSLGAYACYVAAGGSVSGSWNMTTGDRASKLLDLSGNHRHLTQSLSHRNPVYLKKGSTGKSGLLFSQGRKQNLGSINTFGALNDLVVWHIFRPSSRTPNGYMRIADNTSSVASQMEVYQTKTGNQEIFMTANRDEVLKYSSVQGIKTTRTTNRQVCDEWKICYFSMGHRSASSDTEFSHFGYFDPPTEFTPSIAAGGTSLLPNAAGTFYIGIGYYLGYDFDGEWLGTIVFDDPQHAASKKEEVLALITGSMLPDHYYEDSGTSGFDTLSSSLLTYWPMDMITSSATNRYHYDLASGRAIDFWDLEDEVYEGSETFLLNSPNGVSGPTTIDNFSSSNADNFFNVGAADSLSVFTWLTNKGTMTSNEWDVILDTRGSDQSDGYTFFWLDVAGTEKRLEVSISDGTNVIFPWISDVNSDIDFFADTSRSYPHHIGFIINRSTDVADLWYDGVKVATADISSITGVTGDGSPLRFLSNNRFGENDENSIISNVTMISEVITDAQIAQMYRSGRSDYYENYVADIPGLRYHFEYDVTGSWTITDNDFNVAGPPSSITERVTGSITDDIANVTGSYYAMPSGHLRSWKVDGTNVLPKIQVGAKSDFNWMHDSAKFTFATWVRMIDVNVSTDVRTFFANTVSSSASGYGTHIFFDAVSGDKSVECWFQYGGGEWGAKSTNDAINDTDWHHVAVTYDHDDGANRAVIYVDGVDVTDSQTGGVFTPSGNNDSEFLPDLAQVGSGTPDHYANDVRCSSTFWNRKLSEDEIRALFYGGLGWAAGSNLDVTSIP